MHFLYSLVGVYIEGGSGEMCNIYKEIMFL